MSTTQSLRRRQQRAEARKRERIATAVAVQMASDTPHLDGLCPDCAPEQPRLPLRDAITWYTWAAYRRVFRRPSPPRWWPW